MMTHLQWGRTSVTDSGLSTVYVLKLHTCLGFDPFWTHCLKRKATELKCINIHICSRMTVLMQDNGQCLSLHHRGLSQEEAGEALRKRLQDAQCVDLSWNKMDNIDQVLASVHLQEAVFLSFAHNRLQRVQLMKEGINFMHLQELDLSNNQLDVLDDRLFVSMNKLERLYLHNNRLVNLPSSLPQLTRLQILTVQHNLLEKLDLSLRHLQNMIIFQCDNNRLRDFPRCISAWWKLERLDLYKNNIESIPKIDLSSLCRTRAIDLHTNQLVRISGGIRWPTELQVLNLAENKLKTISRRFLDHLPRSCILLLHGNPAINAQPVSIAKLLASNSLRESSLRRMAIQDAVPLTTALRMNVREPVRCANCPLRFGGCPAALLLRPGQARGHHDIPICEPVCSLDCILQQSADRTILLDPTDDLEEDY